MNPQLPAVQAAEQHLEEAAGGMCPLCADRLKAAVADVFPALRDRDEQGTAWCEQVAQENAELRDELERLREGDAD